MKTQLFVLFLLPFALAIPHLKKSTAKSKGGKGDKDANLETSEDGYKSSKIHDVPTMDELSGSKRAGPAALLANPKVQEAVVDKGIEVAGKLVDKQLKIIDEAQQKASDFLKKEIKLDILPDKGWKSEDMFVPPGYHIDASISGGEESPKTIGQVPYLFPAGLGTALMNGCWGTGYKEGDPCYSAKWKSSVCQNMIDGADFMGVGFDGRGKYTPESRKISIVQRNCANKGTYDGLDVPDTMNVHGVYDTSATLMTYESREEYQKHLQEEAGVAGSYFGFYAGVKEAWGESTASSRQKYMAVMDVDIERYEIFLDEVKPQDLSMSFLREFMELPTSYFSAGAPLNYQNFLQRWGTHYVKSAKFGGRLQIRKTMDAEDAKSKKEFEVQMEMEYKSLFASVGASSSTKKGESSRKQSKTTSTSVVAQGGSQDIASILSDVYSPTFKTQFKEWLSTVPKYAKAFHFQIGSITDLINFRANALFPEETVNWGCEGNAANLKTEVKEGKILKYYEVPASDKNKKETRVYCEFDSRQALEDAIQKRRMSLKRAIEIYMEEGALSISDFKLDACESQGDQKFNSEPQISFWEMKEKTSWKEIVKHHKVLKVSFDMFDDLPNTLSKPFNIERNTSRLVRFYENMWYTSDRDGSFHLYGGYNNGNSNNTSQRKIYILGLVLTFNEADSSLFLSDSDFEASKRFFPTLSEAMKGAKLARVEIEAPFEEPSKRSSNSPAAVQPCQVKWSNALRFDPTDTKGKCLHFTASTAGTIFVVFAALPKDTNSRYYVEISPGKVAIYKGTSLKTSTTDIDARALGDASLYQSYFVCITESEKGTLVEYGKSVGTADSGDIYLNMIDNKDRLNVRFYAFGNDKKPSKVMDVHVVSRKLTKAECKGDTVKDLETNICVQKCHRDCDPLAGCKSPKSAKIADGCNACRVALDVMLNKCIPRCPEQKTLTTEKKCVPTFDVKDKVDFDDVPTLSELTICQWIVLDSTFTEGTKSWLNWILASDLQIKLSSILSAKDNQILFRTRIQPDDRQDVEEQKVTLNQLRDFKWHQICVTWSGFNGVVHHYLDGKKILSASNGGRGELPGAPRLSVGSIAQLLTEFNLWDRILSEQEIAENAMKCDGEKGNVIQWHQALQFVKKSKKVYTMPSVCKAPSSSGD